MAERKILHVLPTYQKRLSFGVSALLLIVAIALVSFSWASSLRAQARGHVSSQLAPQLIAIDQLTTTILDMRTATVERLDSTDPASHNTTAIDHRRANQLMAEISSDMDPTLTSANSYLTLSADLSAWYQLSHQLSLESTPLPRSIVQKDTAEISVSSDKLLNALRQFRTSVFKDLISQVNLVRVADRWTAVLMSLSAALVVVVASLFWLGARRLLIRPLNELASSINRVASGDLQHSVTSRASQELEIISSSAEAMRLKLISEITDATTRTILDTGDKERRRIAEGLHDEPMQFLSVAKLRSTLLSSEASTVADSEAAAAIADLISGAMTHLRTAIFDLTQPDLDQGLVSAIFSYLEQLSQEIETHFHSDAKEPSELEATILYRAARIACSNAVLHGNARKLTGKLSEGNGRYLLTISDDGSGFAKSRSVSHKPGHLGLASLRKVLQAVGGQLQLVTLEEGLVWIWGSNIVELSDQLVSFPTLLPSSHGTLLAVSLPILSKEHLERQSVSGYPGLSGRYPIGPPILDHPTL